MRLPQDGTGFWLLYAVMVAIIAASLAGLFWVLIYASVQVMNAILVGTVCILLAFFITSVILERKDK